MAYYIWMNKNTVFCVQMPSEWEDGECFLLTSLRSVHRSYELGTTPLLTLFQFNVNADHSLRGPAV